MYVLMSYHSAPLTESLTTHCTGIRSLTTMYAFMCYQIAMFTESLTTNCRHKDAHHYVCVDV